MKQPASLNDESDFVFIVPMLTAELRKHRIKTRCLRSDADHIRRHVAAASLQGFDFPRVGLEDFISRRVRLDRMRRFPDFIVDSDTSQVIRHRGLFRQRAILFRNANDCHMSLLRTRNSYGSIICRRPTDSKRNSKISTCRAASARSLPHVYNP